MNNTKTKKVMVSILLTTLLFISNCFAQSEKQKITVSKIKVFLDDIELTADNSFSSPFDLQTILSFTKLKADKQMDLTSFEKEVQETQLRLLNSGYFYTAKVEIIPPRKNPEKRSVIISVTTGFLQRFGGGGIYAVYGRVGLMGNRTSLIGFAGYNHNGIIFQNENCFNTPIIFCASLATNAPASLIEKKDTNLSANLKAGSFITPDLRFCVDICSNFILGDAASFISFDRKDFCLSPYLFLEKYFSNQIYFTNETRSYWNPLFAENSSINEKFMMEDVQTINWRIGNKLTIAELTAFGTNFGNNSAETMNFDLSVAHSSISDYSGLNNRAIRSGYGEQELQFEKYLLFSGEVRFQAANFTIPPIFPCEIVPFLYTDVAITKKGEFDAFGVGVQLNFACPIFAYFNFMYGFNHLGKGKFFFTAKKSF